MMRAGLAIALWAAAVGVADAQSAPATMPPEATEVWTPVPVMVTPGAHNTEAPSDAVVLFNGANLNQWRSANGGPAHWRVDGGAMIVAPGAGDIVTAESFGDAQLHIEWRTPVLDAHFTGQDRGNSGVYLQGRYEVQVLDTFENRTYVNGQAGSIYKQYAPLVNAARPAGQWQTYDIIFRAPRFLPDGALSQPARMTVLLNGVLIQNDAVLSGGTTYIGLPKYEAHGDAPLLLQDHGHEVAFRNVWIRRL